VRSFNSDDRKLEHPDHLNLPQVVEHKTPQSQDAIEEFESYYECITRVYVADVKSEEFAQLQIIDWRVYIMDKNEFEDKWQIIKDQSKTW
jgi:hypothetical protein